MLAKNTNLVLFSFVFYFKFIYLKYINNFLKDPKYEKLSIKHT